MVFTGTGVVFKLSHGPESIIEKRSEQTKVHPIRDKPQTPNINKYGIHVYLESEYIFYLKRKGDVMHM